MKTEGTLIYHKITVATGLLQNNAYGNELELFYLIILRPSTSVDAIVLAISRSDCN